MTHRRVGTLIAIALSLHATGLRAQATQSDTLPAAARDSVLDAALFDVVLSYTLLGDRTFYLSPYSVLPGIADSAPIPRHDAGWLRRAQVRHHAVAICAVYGSDRCAPHNGGIYVTLTPPRIQPNGLAAVVAQVYTVWSSQTERHAAETGEGTIYLNHAKAGWAVYCHGIYMHDQGTLTDPLPLR